MMWPGSSLEAGVLVLGTEFALNHVSPLVEDELKAQVKLSIL